MTAEIGFIPPFLYYFIGAAVLAFVKGKSKPFVAMLFPVLALLSLFKTPIGTTLNINYLNFNLGIMSVDKLSFLFALIFIIMSFVFLVYTLNFKFQREYSYGMAYSGCALGAIFAGDLISFFIFWELLNVTSVFFILFPKLKDSVGTAMRYFLMHTVGGLVLMAGIFFHVHELGSTAMLTIELGSLSSYLILLGIGLNVGFPLLHTWIVDAYPKASIGGTVIMSATTTKVAIYALARLFPGTDLLIWVGAVMVIFPILYAIIENDLRKVLAYSMINQLGFMVVAIGVGTEMALNGATSHVFSHILYKSLLFMSIGAVIYRTGTAKASELGGLYKSMPLTCLFCIVGALSISAFPLFSGFVSKSMIVSAVVEQHDIVMWFILLIASAGALEHAGVKVPFFTFFSHDSGFRVKEAPLNMLLAMGAVAFGCIFIGVYPDLLYSILPYHVDYEPYTWHHIITQMQLLLFAGLAVWLLILSGVYPPELPRINLDFDWVYRRLASGGANLSKAVLNAVNRETDRIVQKDLIGGFVFLSQNLPAYLAVGVLTPVWLLIGKTDSQIEDYSRYIHAKLKSNSLPVGVTALLILAVFGFLLVL